MSIDAMKQALAVMDTVAPSVEASAPRYYAAREALRAAIEQAQEPVAQELVDKAGSPCPEFWDWLPKAYRDGDKGADPKFTKYNMEVAYLAGSTTYKELLNKSEARLHEVAVHCERVERRLKEVNTAAMNLTHDLVCMDYDDDDRLNRDRVMGRIMQWRNEWDKAMFKERNT
jgi:hypothetical protein